MQLKFVSWIPACAGMTVFGSRLRGNDGVWVPASTIAPCIA